MPGKIPDKGRTPSLPRTYCNIPHNERPQYGKNLSIVALLQLRQEATKVVYREGILEPYHAFKYQSSNSLGSTELGD